MRAALLGLFCLLAWASPARASETLRPGATIGGCTMNWVYDGLDHLAGRVYVGTANHCIENIGQRIADGAGVEFGTVAVTGDYLNSDWDSDYALIEVDLVHHSRVEPSMAGHPEIPARHIGQDDMEIGDLLQMSGWGGLTAQHESTRENRQAVLTENDGRQYNSLAPVSGGDSGGPIAHVKTGGAVGVVSGWNFLRPGNLVGPTVWALIEDASSRGFPVRLRLAGERQPPLPPPPPPPPAAPASAPAPKPASPPKREAKKRKACPKGKKRSKKSKRCRKRR